jgi:hypothetical protein
MVKLLPIDVTGKPDVIGGDDDDGTTFVSPVVIMITSGNDSDGEGPSVVCVEGIPETGPPGTSERLDDTVASLGGKLVDSRDVDGCSFPGEDWEITSGMVAVRGEVAAAVEFWNSFTVPGTSLLVAQAPCLSGPAAEARSQQRQKSKVDAFIVGKRNTE